MLRVLARAKVNYTLDILAKRGDGFHELESVMQSIALHDRLCITAAEDLRLQVEIKPGAACWIPCDERNDVMRAARLLQLTCGIEAGARLHLSKFIPTQAGLGGGSADAAAALLGLNHFWRLGLREDELLELAAQLGSDVAFTLRGGTALCRGRGEQLTPLKGVAEKWLVLFKPPRGISTAKVFQGLDLAQLSAATTERFISALNEPQLDPFSYIGNHLQEAVFRQIDELRHFAARLERYGVRSWQMSGSGTTVFALAEDRVEAEILKNRLTPPQWWSFVTQTSCRGAEIRR